MLDPPTDTSVEECLAQIPALSGVPRRVEHLPGGLTNLNLKVTTPDGIFVARVNQSDSALLGIDREAEHLNSVAAAEAGVGAPVVDYRPDLGILLIEYVDGVTYDNATFNEHGVVPRVADAMRRLHTGPRFVNTFDMFSRQARYRRLVEENGFAIPATYDDHAQSFEQISAVLQSRPMPTVPCNNDLLAGNMLDDGERIWLIDYEYSGNNDACFELGNTSTECALDDDQTAELVASYFGRPLRNTLARTRAQAIVSQYGWSLWGFIQAATSPLDFDFTEWGMQRFEGAVAAFGARGFQSLLDDVRRDD